MGRRPCCAKVGLNKGAWSAREDKILANYVEVHGEGKWRHLPQNAGLKRCGKSCRLRWLNYLRPGIKRGNISVEEEELIIRLHKLLGNRWSLIAGRLPGRTDNEIKNYWNTNLSKRFQDNKNIIDQELKKQPDDSKKMNSKQNLKGTTVYQSKHQVIRTKAVRCTKAVDIPGQQPLCNINHKHQKHENNDLNPSSPVLQVQNLSDFLLDLEICELLLPGTPNLELGQGNEINVNECDDHVECGDYSPDIDLSCSLHFPVLPSEDKLDVLMDNDVDAIRDENWRAFQPNDALDLNSLAKFLNSDEDWII